MSTQADDQPVNGEVVPYTPASVEEYRPRIVMLPEEACALDTALRDNMKAVLRKDVDYGVIPGTGSKPTLLKPGAEKLLQWFGFGHTMEQVETERGPDNTWLGVTYRCTVTKAMPDGRVVTVGTCEGYAGYDEDRFCLSAEAATAKEQANASRYRRQVNPSKCVEYRAPRNSVVKMAQKRALVGAALQATSASTLFTQDIEDNADPGVSADASIASAASEVITTLPEEVRRGVDAWRKEQGWPRSGEWDAAQWCAALVQAGRLDSLAPGSMARAHPAGPSGDQWTSQPAPAGCVEGTAASDWVEEAVELAAGLATKDAATKLYSEAVAKSKAGEVTEEQKSRICNLIIARMEDLAKEPAPVEGTISPPDGDPWAAKVEEVTCTGDAVPVLAELDAAHEAGWLDSRRHKALRQAVNARALSGEREQAQAVKA